MVKSSSRAMPLVVFAALASAGLGQAARSVPSDTQTTGPIVRPVTTSPLGLRGERFRSGEKVTVTIVVRAATRTATRRASASGTFSVTFPGIVVDRCSSVLIVRAIGARGSRAGFSLAQRDCEDA